MVNEKNNLVDQNPQQKDPYRAKASEFPSKRVVSAFGQGTDDAGQKNDLAKQSKNQEGPRYAETEGGNSDSFSDAAKNKAAGFKISQNSGESGTDGVSAVSVPEGIDCSTGKIVSKGYNPTKVGEVADKLVRIG